jgi:hypothetical protein
MKHIGWNGVSLPHPGLGRGIVAGQSGRLEVDRLALGNVRFGSKADIDDSSGLARPPKTRFGPPPAGTP